MALKAQKHTPAGQYGTFMTGLMGLEDDATLLGYSKKGIKLLREAISVFGAEFDERHRGQSASEPPSDKGAE